MKLTVAQTHGSADIDANRNVVERLIGEAAQSGSDLVAFPEMSLFDFFPRHPHNYEYFKRAEPIPGPTCEWFGRLARKHDIRVVFNHYERSPEGVFFDTSVLIDRDGATVGRQRMMHIAEEPGYNEKFYYTAGWDDYRVFDVDGWGVAIATCYDRHFPEVFRCFLLNGAHVVIIPTAVAKSEPFGATYELEMRAAAVTHGVYVALANRTGAEPPLDFLGQSMVIDPRGEIICRLGEDPNTLCTAELSMDALIEARTLYPFLRDRRPETYGKIAEVPRG